MYNQINQQAPEQLIEVALLRAQFMTYKNICVKRSQQVRVSLGVRRWRYGRKINQVCFIFQFGISLLNIFQESGLFEITSTNIDKVCYFSSLFDHFIYLFLFFFIDDEDQTPNSSEGGVGWCFKENSNYRHREILVIKAKINLN